MLGVCPPDSIHERIASGGLGDEINGIGVLAQAGREPMRRPGLKLCDENAVSPDRRACAILSINRALRRAWTASVWRGVCLPRRQNYTHSRRRRNGPAGLRTHGVSAPKLVQT